MNSSNDNKQSEAGKIAVKELLNGSNDNKKSEEKITIEALLNSSESERVAINELTKQSYESELNFPLEPNSIEVKPLSYQQALMLNILKQTP